MPEIRPSAKKIPIFRSYLEKMTDSVNKWRARRVTQGSGTNVPELGIAGA